MTKGAPGRGPAEFMAWWIKCDPTSEAHDGWNWPDLFREYRRGQPYRWSVGPTLSQKNARLARPGDPIFGYAAGEGHRQLMALAEVEQGGVFVPGEGPLLGASPFRGGYTVALKPIALLKNSVSLADVRDAMTGADPEFLRTRFGSIFKVRASEFGRLMAAVRAENRSLALPRAWGARAKR